MSIALGGATSDPLSSVILTEESQFEQFITVLQVYETRGEGEDFANAVGDDGDALGCLQMHEVALLDVNRNFGTQHKHEDLLGNVELARWACRKYFEVHESQWPTYEELARFWNGGPRWREKRHKTDKYWCEFRDFLYFSRLKVNGYG